MPYDPYKALYIHIPFCVSRCRYCDFTTSACKRDDPRIQEYIEELILAIRRNAKEGKLAHIETLYLGGGTPSHLPTSKLTSLLYALGTSLDLTKDTIEFTMEANPESLNTSLVKDIWALGVNRLSIGVQSFDDDVLKILGRAHDSATARKAIAFAQERFDNISIDLMCGIPGQSNESLEKSINTAIELGIPHISVYPLTIEPHTPLDRDLLAGLIEEPDSDFQAEHMLLAQKLLTDAGYTRYEVASYAKPGYECKHNICYWTGVPYLGIGLAATTMTQNDERRMRVTNNEVTDNLNRSQMEAEDLMLGMRMSKGISAARLQEASVYLPQAIDVMNDLISEGYVEHIEGAYRPTEQGWLCGNELYERLLSLSD